MRCFLIAVALLSLAACAGQQIRKDGYPVNFVQVRQDVVRSGQPVGAEWRDLYLRGVRHSITFSFPDERPDDPNEDAARAAGIKVHRVFIQPSSKGIDIFARPSPEAIATMLALALRIRDARGEEGIWLAHCLNGHDRTGWFIACFIRMLLDGWSKERAWDEMVAQGYHQQLPGLDLAFHEFAERLGR